MIKQDWGAQTIVPVCEGSIKMGWLDITAFYSTGFGPLPASLMQFYYPNLPDLLRTAAHWLSKGSHMHPHPWAQFTVYIHTSLKIRIKIWLIWNRRKLPDRPPTAQSGCTSVTLDDITMWRHMCLLMCRWIHQGVIYSERSEIMDMMIRDVLYNRSSMWTN